MEATDFTRCTAWFPLLWTCYVLTLAAFWVSYEYRSVASVFFYGSELLLAPRGCIRPPSDWFGQCIKKYLGHRRDLKKPTMNRDNAERHRLILNWDNRKCYNSIQQMLTRFRSRMFNCFILIRNPGTMHHNGNNFQNFVPLQINIFVWHWMETTFLEITVFHHMRNLICLFCKARARLVGIVQFTVKEHLTMISCEG